MTIKIEKGVPFPRQPGTSRKYPWLEMEIGDSFTLETPDKTRASSYASQASRTYAPRKFVGSCAGGTNRIWRTA